VETKIEVGVCDVRAVADILHIEQLSVEGLTNLAEIPRELTKLTSLVAGRRVFNGRYEEDAVLRELSHGSQQAEGFLQARVGNEKMWCFRYGGNVPYLWAYIFVERGEVAPGRVSLKEWCWIEGFMTVRPFYLKSPVCELHAGLARCRVGRDVTGVVQLLAI
jgi:hypothetical protein